MFRSTNCLLKRCLFPKKLWRPIPTLTGLKYREIKQEVPDPVSLDSKDYIPVYKLPYIRHISMINRLKWYQTVIAGLSLPGTGLLWQLDFISMESFLSVGVIVLGLWLPLFTIGYVATNVIGIIYLNEKTDMIKVSYIDYWGKRKDIEIPINDIVPISDMTPSVADKLYITFQRYSTEGTLKVNIEHGIILDSEKFKQIL